MGNKKQRTLWAFDCETDPFLYGRKPQAFLWCAVSEKGDRIAFWGDDATERFLAWLYELKNCLFIAHNGGKFDLMFLRDGIHGAMLMVDGRILKCKIGECEMRDSFAILPMALKKLGAKFEIELDKLERNRRERYRQEITRYCMQDCIVLLEAVQDFYQRAGRRRLTIASQASHELRSIYPDLPKLDAQHHADFKPFYFGGRVEAFEKGDIRGEFSMYDVNSMYPAVMANCWHPYGSAYDARPFSIKNLPDDNCGFFRGICDTQGAFPVRMEDKTTPYAHGRYEVNVTLHEVRAALETGTAKNFSGTLIIPANKTKFDKFILPHYAARLKARECGDAGGDIYHKLIPNSSYGRFAMSPDGRDERYFTDDTDDLAQLKAEGWKADNIDLDSGRWIMKRPTQRPWQFYEDVATGASITGASRAQLLYAKAGSKRVLYCDTDSLLCQTGGFAGEINPNKLGAWKHEGDFDRAAIAGKKTYALYKDGECIKKASKGVNASAEQITAAANGEIIEIMRDAPTMRISGTKFVSRKIRKT